MQYFIEWHYRCVEGGAFIEDLFLDGWLDFIWIVVGVVVAAAVGVGGAGVTVAAGESLVPIPTRRGKESTGTFVSHGRSINQCNTLTSCWYGR